MTSSSSCPISPRSLISRLLLFELVLTLKKFFPEKKETERALMMIRGEIARKALIYCSQLYPRFPNKPMNRIESQEANFLKRRMSRQKENNVLIPTCQLKKSPCLLSKSLRQLERTTSNFRNFLSNLTQLRMLSSDSKVRVLWAD